MTNNDNIVSKPGKLDLNKYKARRKKSIFGMPAISGLAVCAAGIMLPTVIYFGASMLSAGYNSSDPDTKSSDASAVVSEEKIDESEVAAITPEVSILTSEQLLEAYAWTTRAKVEELNLKRFLKIQIAEDKSLIVWGKLTETASKRYVTFKTWYASKSDFPILREQVEVVEESDLFPQIRSVWLGSVPKVHFDNGEVAQVGSEIGDGWEVVEIDQLAVKLKRNGKTMSLTY
ncbi:MAG: hypothetical protein AAF217_01445 [Pseudomonadota bacterium]